MIDTSAAFRAAIVGSPRRIEVLAVVDITDPDMVITAPTMSELTAWSDAGRLYDHDFEAAPRMTILEENYWGLDGATVADAGTSEPTTEQLSGADGTFSPTVFFQQNFTGVELLQACSVFFPADPAAGVGADLTVEIFEGNTVRHTATVTGNVATQVALTGFSVSAPTAIRVSISRWSLPYRRARVVEILPGIYEEWGNDMLASFSARQQADVSCLTLPYGTVTLSMDNSSRRFEPRSKDGVFQSIEDRQGIEVYIGVRTAQERVERCRLGTFYQSGGGWRTGSNALTMEWYLVDIVGLLAQRDFIPPSPLPTTLSGWLAALVAQLGVNFAQRYKVDAAYADAAATVRSAAAVTSVKCGDVLKWVCQATGTFPRADAATGYLTAEPTWSSGGEVTLDNLSAYPTLKANDDVSALIFTLGDEAGTQLVVPGTSAAGMTVAVSNPFLQTSAQALAAARRILSCYGGNRVELVGRGDPSSEIGDVDTVWLDESQATTARRVSQDFRLDGGVLRGCRSTLLQADGSYLYESRAVVAESGTWTAPEGVEQLRLILVGKGGRGKDGEDGSFDGAGANGAIGLGGRVWSGTVAINSGQSFTVSIGEETTFGGYSSANGTRYSTGYTDVLSGDSFARSGVTYPLPGSGDGGAGGRGGAKGNKHDHTIRGTDITTGEPIIVVVPIIDNAPGTGKSGVEGATGCAVIYWDKGGTHDPT